MKKSFTVLLALIMLASCTLLAVPAAAAGEPLTFEVQKVENAPNRAEVTVDISIKNNPGIAGVTFRPEYDATHLELIDMNFNDVLYPGILATASGFSWANSTDPMNDNSANGKFVTLTFKTKNLEPLTEYPVSLVVDTRGGGVANANCQEVPYNIVPGYVKAGGSGSIIDTGRTLSLAGEININQYVKIKGFDNVDLTKDAGLLVFKREITEEEAIYENASNDEIKVGLLKSGEEYGQRTDGIPVRRYTEPMYLRVYIKNTDGTYSYMPLIKYNVRDYCEKMIKGNKRVKDVCIDLLHFGASAQKYFAWRTDDLADKNIIAEYPVKAWNPGLLTPLATAQTAIKATNDITDNGKTLSLDGAIKINYYFGAGDIEVQSAELLFWDGVSGTLTESNCSYRKPLTRIESKYGVEYGAQSNEFTSRQYDKTIFACAKIIDKNGNIHYSELTSYSPEEYARVIIDKNKKPALVETLKNMVIYGESAKIYFNK